MSSTSGHLLILIGIQNNRLDLAKVPDYNLVYSQGLSNDKKVG